MGSFFVPIVGGAVNTLTPDVGGAVIPIAGDILVLGGTNINTAGAGNVLTVNLDNTVSITGDFTTTLGDIEATVGYVSAHNLATIGDPAKGLDLEDNYIYAVGTDANIDIGIVTKGTGAFVIDCITGGGLASQWRTAQTYLQTIGAADATLLSIPIATEQMVIITATVNAYLSTYGHASTGTITVSAYRPTAGNVTLVGMIQTDFASSSPAAVPPTLDADVDVGTQTLRIRISGVAAETWNWVTTYSYMYTTHP